MIKQKFFHKFTRNSIIKGLNLKLSIFIFTVIFFLIVYKAITIPVTHDEVSTVVHYYNFNIWQIMMYPDNWPNNHILNTLFTKFFINLFGKEVWAIRLPNIISYFIYTFAIYRIIKIYFKENSLFILATIALFLTNPYLLDFFGLCRGYAMTLTFVTLSSSYLISGFIKNKETDIWFAVITSILASYANFTALIFWSSITVITSLYFFLNHNNDIKKIIAKISLLTFLSISYLALIITPLKKMISTNEFEYWSSKGFYKDTILSLVENWRYGDRLLSGISNNFLGILIVITFICTLIIIIIKWIKSGSFNKIINDKLTLPFLILSFTILVNLIQIIIMQTPNINGRIALFLYPIFVILIIALLSEFEKFRLLYPKYIFAILIPLFLFYHLSNSYLSDSVREWWYDANNQEVIEYIKKENPGDTVSLKTQWWFYPSFYFYTSTGKASGIKLEKNNNTTNHGLDKNTSAEYYYIMDSEAKQLEPKFVKVKRFGWDRWLMKRK